jgi:hypothetical protein
MSSDLVTAGVHNKQQRTKLVGLPPEGISQDEFFDNHIGGQGAAKHGRKVISNHSSNGGNKSGANSNQIATRSSNMALS